MQFLNSIVGSGYVTHLVMAPGWKDSAGAKAKVSVAKGRGLEIIDKINTVDLQRILRSATRYMTH